MASDPTAIINGLLTGSIYNGAKDQALDQQQSIVQTQAAQQQMAQAAAAAQAKQTQQARVNDALTKYRADPSIDNMVQVAIADPERAAAYKDAWEMKDQATAANHVQAIAPIYSALQTATKATTADGKQRATQLAIDNLNALADASERGPAPNTSMSALSPGSASAGSAAPTSSNDATELRRYADLLKQGGPDNLNLVISELLPHLAAGKGPIAEQFAKAMADAAAARGKGQVVGRAIGHYENGKWVTDYRDPEAAQYRTVDGVDEDGKPIKQVIQVGGGVAGGQPAPVAGGAAAPLSVRLNNPGAIRFDPKNQWQGQVGQQNGFAQFDTPENGARAHQILIANQIKKGYDTPAAWAAHYAPASDGNNPQAYAQTVATGLGIGVNDKIPMSAVPKMASLSAQVEAGGSPPSTAGPSGSGSPQPTAIVGSPTAPGGKVVYTSRTSAGTGLDASTIDFYGQKVAAGEDLTHLGLGMGKEASAMKQAILARAAQIQTGQGMTGGDSNLLHADVKSAGMSLTALQKTRNSLNPFIQTFDGASAQVRALAPQAVGGSIPIFNRWIQAGRTNVSGDPAVSKFNVAINAVANENAKIMSGASGGAVTSDSARHEAMTLINNAQTLDQLNAVLDQMHTDSTLRVKSLDDRQGELRGIISGKTGSSGSTGGAPAPARPAPRVGSVVRGFRFNGGNPADRTNWVPAQ